MKFMLAEIVDSIAIFIKDLISNFSLNLDSIFFIAIGFQTLMIIFYLIKSRYAYEGRLERTLDNLSRWLYFNKTIDSGNLIEFNNRMKKSPKLLRYHWQQYMLYREHAPSYYMSMYNCIEKPLHTSSYKANIKNLKNINITLIFISFIFGFAAIGGGLDAASILRAAIVPMIVCILNTLFLMLLRTMQNYNLSSLYQNFHLFQRYIDKASATLPEYVDFEVLFTRKEIKKGIPVLNEYLEKRDRLEREELEKARLNAVEHEKYDFSECGIDGALVLDRAIKETEVYLNVRQRLLYEIQQLESEMESAKRNYENTSKEYQRKMQASKENVERLRKQQEETTNRIESNYIKKQQGDEIKKQEQLEKDQDDATLRFNQQVSSLQTEIDQRRTELDSRKDYVQECMMAEYQTFSNKLYDKISEDVQVKFNEHKEEINQEKDGYIAQLEQANILLDSKEKEIEELKAVIARAGINVGDYGMYYNQELQQEAQKIRLGKENEAKLYQETPIYQEPVYEEYQHVEQPVEEIVEQPVEEIIEQPVEEPVEEPVSQDGYYDENGYYWYPNGAYYDDKGNYHDELGGVYDTEGNYTPPVEQPVEEPVEQPVEEPVEEPVSQDGYYDENGYYWYPNGAYYDDKGNYHDELGGVYDTEGNYTPPVEQPVEEPLQDQTQEQVEEKIEEPAVEEPAIEEQPHQEIMEEVQPATEEEIIEPVKEEPAEEQGTIEGQEQIFDWNFSEDDDINAQEILSEVQQEEQQEQIQEKPVEEQPAQQLEEQQPVEESETEQKVEEPIVESAPVEEQPVEEAEAPQKKRGRPRKIVEEAEEQPKRKVGRPKKVATEEVEEQPKRKPGRPRKVAEEVEEQPKRKVGRPKKEEIDEELKVDAPKKKAGRPKGSTNSSKPKENSKRGRPKGSPKIKLNKPVESSRKNSKLDTAEELRLINEQILAEQKKLLKEQKELNETIIKIKADDKDGDKNE